MFFMILLYCVKIRVTVEFAAEFTIEILIIKYNLGKDYFRIPVFKFSNKRFK